MSFTGVDAELNKIRAELKKLEQKAVVEVRATAADLLENLFDHTPVWQGTTVRNFHVSVGSPTTISRAGIGRGSTGPTNQMALGEEPRRPANEEAARSEAAAALAQLSTLQDVFITNGSEHWDLVDAGLAPGGADQNIRNPGGVSRLAIQATLTGRQYWRQA